MTEVGERGREVKVSRGRRKEGDGKVEVELKSWDLQTEAKPAVLDRPAGREDSLDAEDRERA